MDYHEEQILGGSARGEQHGKLGDGKILAIAAADAERLGSAGPMVAAAVFHEGDVIVHPAVDECESLLARHHTRLCGDFLRVCGQSLWIGLPRHIPANTHRSRLHRKGHRAEDIGRQRTDGRGRQVGTGLECFAFSRRQSEYLPGGGEDHRLLRHSCARCGTLCFGARRQRRILGQCCRGKRGKPGRYRHHTAKAHAGHPVPGTPVTTRPIWPSFALATSPGGAEVFPPAFTAPSRAQCALFAVDLRCQMDLCNTVYHKLDLSEPNTIGE